MLFPRSPVLPSIPTSFNFLLQTLVFFKLLMFLLLCVAVTWNCYMSCLLVWSGCLAITCLSIWINKAFHICQTYLHFTPRYYVLDCPIRNPCPWGPVWSGRPWPILLLCSGPVLKLPWLVPLYCRSDLPFLATVRTFQYQPLPPSVYDTCRVQICPCVFSCLRHTHSSSSLGAVFLMYSWIFVVLPLIVALMVTNWSTIYQAALKQHADCLKGNSGIFKPRPYFWHEIRSSTHRESSTPAAAAQLIHSGKDVHHTQSCRSDKSDRYPAMLHKSISSKLRMKLADCHRARSK